MIYIIDDQVTYNSDDCTLSHIPTQESLSLSISSGRLFEQLLKSEGEILERDKLLTEVWDKYGLRGSNSNLNQYLSILRRALAAYGCDNLIVTIPKIGIRLNTEIKIVREPAPAVVVSDISESKTAEAVGNPLLISPSEFVVTVPLSAKRPGVYRRAIFAGIMLFLMIVIFGYYIFTHYSQQTSGFSTIKLDGGCEVVLIQGLDVVERQSINKQLQEMLKENNQSCTAGRRIYFDKNTSFSTSNFGRTILSVCNLDSNGHIITCDNFYYLDWRMF